MKIAMSVIWLILVVLFVLLGMYYHSQSARKIPHIETSVRPLQREDSALQVQVSVAGSELDEPLHEFVRKLNEQIDETNLASSRANRLTAYGYYLASFAAFVSMMIEWRESLAKLF